MDVWASTSPAHLVGSKFGRCFFFNDTATTEIYTLSLHDALPIFCIDALVVCFLESAVRHGDLDMVT